jgi:glycosyltransferase involved in cell wall biosynthesis
MVLSDKKRLMFSIIIPAYNYADVLDRSIRSVLNQTGDDFEILIIDDGSTDNTPKIMCGYQKEFPEKIKYFIQKIKDQQLQEIKGLSYLLGTTFFFWMLMMKWRLIF